MSQTISEATAAKAFKKYRQGNIRECIQMLVDYADRHVNNAHTAEIFKNAIDAELAPIDPAVSRPDDDAPTCTHCGSTSTYFRLTEGDVACNDCPGIMPHDEVVEK